MKIVEWLAFFLLADNVIPYLIDCLRALQHRGQESWGIAIPNKSPFRKLGLDFKIG